MTKTHETRPEDEPDATRPAAANRQGDPVVHLAVALSQLRGRPIDIEATAAALLPAWGSVVTAQAMHRAFGFACGSAVSCALESELDGERLGDAIEELRRAGLGDLLDRDSAERKT